MFEFEELIADMLGITDAQREDDTFVQEKFFEKFEIDMELASYFAERLLEHTPTIQTSISGDMYHAFVNKEANCMLMRMKAKT